MVSLRRRPRNPTPDSSVDSSDDITIIVDNDEVSSMLVGDDANSETQPKLKGPCSEAKKNKKPKSPNIDSQLHPQLKIYIYDAKSVSNIFRPADLERNFFNFPSNYVNGTKENVGVSGSRAKDDLQEATDLKNKRIYEGPVKSNCPFPALVVQFSGAEESGELHKAIQEVTRRRKERREYKNYEEEMKSTSSLLTIADNLKKTADLRSEGTFKGKSVENKSVGWDFNEVLAEEFDDDEDLSNELDVAFDETEEEPEESGTNN